MNNSIQSEEIEIPIGFAQSLSCVMSSRICLHVRGFIRGEDDLPFPSVSYPARRGTFGSVHHHNSSRPTDHSTSIVHEGSALTAVELRELRVMRAASPKHIRKYSRGKSESLEEIVHIK